MGGISKEQLASIINRSRDLCTEEGAARVDEAIGNRRSGKNMYIDEDPSNYDGDADYFDRMYSSSVDEGRTQKNGGRDISYSEIGINNSHMDEKIKKSFMTNPIDRSSLYQESVLEGMNIPPKQRQQKQQVVEQKQYQPSVDYSLIKTIVKECINEYFSKKPINEGSSLSTIGLKNGYIKLVDSSGNVYSAKLQKIGNKNNDGQS